MKDSEGIALVGGESREDPRGDGVLCGDGGGFGFGGVDAAEGGETMDEVPAADLAPRDGGAIAASDAEAGEVGKDLVASDQCPIVGGEHLAEHGDDASLHGLRVMGGAFASQVAFTRHEMLLTPTQGDGYIRPYDRGTT
jgi:hypothetical protein